jgi:hypothetical protein
MKAISAKLGSGAVKHMQLADAVQEEWADMLTLDVKFQTSPEFL